MNNHYGESRIFGKARFMAEESGDGDNGIGDNNGAGGSDEPSSNELNLQIAKLQADLERAKHANDKLAKNNKELTDKARQYMSDEQKAQADREARDQELESLKKEVRITKYSKRLVGIGMTEAEADELAGAIPEMENSDAFFDKLSSFVDNVKKAAEEVAVQKLLEGRPDINAGYGDGSARTIAEDKAISIGKRNARRSEDNKATDFYKI